MVNMSSCNLRLHSPIKKPQLKLSRSCGKKMDSGNLPAISSNDSVNPDINPRMNMKGPLLIAFVIAIILLTIWDGVWKLIALWKSARHDQLAWFICLAIFNTVGILPILYILFFQKNGTEPPPIQYSQGAA